MRVDGARRRRTHGGDTRVSKATKMARERRRVLFLDAKENEEEDQERGVLGKDEDQQRGGFSLSEEEEGKDCLLYTSPSPRDATLSRMPSSA